VGWRLIGCSGSEGVLVTFDGELDWKPHTPTRFSPNNTHQSKTGPQDHKLLQIHELRLGFLQDGNIGVGVFPEGEEIFVSGERPDAGGIGIRSLRGSRL
jgi:hypothetical protein